MGDGLDAPKTARLVPVPTLRQDERGKRLRDEIGQEVSKPFGRERGFDQVCRRGRHSELATVRSGTSRIRGRGATARRGRRKFAGNGCCRKDRTGTLPRTRTS